ncbi:MAG: hypothetical protein UIG59_02285, partial [Acutalibacteraceae bacterium]|nr:hypothetical protein [Acutalibacteraceae bacterium]
IILTEVICESKKTLSALARGMDIYPRCTKNITVSDKDMQNRLEQTELVLSTLRHFGYDMSKISLDLRHGTHCHYTYPDKRNAQGESLFGEMIYNFISSVN